MPFASLSHQTQTCKDSVVVRVWCGCWIHLARSLLHFLARDRTHERDAGIHMHLYMYMYICVQISFWHKQKGYIYIYVYIYVHTYVYIYIYIYMYIYIYVICFPIHICREMYIYIYLYINAIRLSFAWDSIVQRRCPEFIWLDLCCIFWLGTAHMSGTNVSNTLTTHRLDPILSRGNVSVWHWADTETSETQTFR